MKFQKFIIFSSALISLLGFLVISGWMFNIPVFKSGLPGYVTMKFNTAICFILAGTSLYLTISGKGKFWQQISAAMAILILSIAVLELSQNLFNYQSGIDQFFIRDIGSAAANLPYPGMMSPLTAICFFLSGFALLGIKSEKKIIQELVQFVLHLVTVLAFIAIIGYLLNVPVFYKMSLLASMAVHTAFGLFILSIATSLIHPYLGITGLFTGTSIGNKMARSLFSQLTITILILSYVRIELHRFGLVSVDFGIVLFALSFILTSLFLVWRASSELNRVDQKKSEVEASLAERQKLQEGLQKSKEQFLAFFNMNPVATIIATYNDGKIWYANEAFLKLFSYEQSIIGKTTLEINLIDPRDRAELRAHLEKNQMRLKSFETKLKDGNGKVRNTIISNEKIDFESNGYIITSILDITERMENEAKLKELSDRLTLATKNSSIGIWDYDVANNILKWDEIMFKLYGVRQEDFSGTYATWKERLHADDYVMADNDLEMALSGEKEFDSEFRVVWPDSSIRYIKAQGLVQRDGSGKPLRIIGTNRDITNKKIAEAEIKQSNQRNRIFVEQAPGALAMFDTAMCYMAASRQWITDYNLSNKEIIGRSHYEIFPEIGEDWKKIHQECLKGAVNRCDEASFERSDGTLQWINWDVRPWYISEGNIGGLLMYTADITHLKEKDKEKRRIEDILDKTNEIARIGTWEVDLIAGQVLWSRVTREIHEVPSEFIPDLATAINFFKPGENQNKIQHVVTQAIEKGTAYDVEVELITGKGKTIWVRAIGQAEFEKGKCKRLYGVFQDINEKKQSERVIVEERKLLKTVIDNLPLNVYIKDLNSRKILVNRKECEYLGINEEDILGKSDFDLYPHDSAVISLAEDHRVFSSGKAIEFKETFNFKNDGSGTWFITTKVPLQNENNKVTGLLGIGFDITTRKQAENQIQRLLNEMQSVMDATTAVAIIGTDVIGTITHFNKGAERLLGYSAEEMIGKNTPLIFHLASEIEKHAEDLSTLYGRVVSKFDVFTELAQNSQHDSHEWSYKRKDGSIFPVQLIVTPVANETTKIIGFLGVATDITERKEAEIKVRNYSILESKSKEMEQFAYITSHDLREPLLTIKNYIEILLEDYGDVLNENGKKYTESIVKAANRMDILINGLLDYSRLSKVKKLQIVDCNDVIKEVQADLESLIRTNQAIITVEKLPVLNGYQLEIKLLFQNLINNAIKFKKNNVDPEVHISAKEVTNGWQFLVKDNGIGIAEKNKDKIFIIFQRLHNRNEYEGTGIGLAHCKKIVELHNGHIWVESIPGQSSSFYFTILTENL